MKVKKADIDSLEALVSEVAALSDVNYDIAYIGLAARDKWIQSVKPEDVS